MRISAESLRPGLQRLAREQAPTMKRLREALEILYRDRTGGRTADEILEIVLLSVARAHEHRTQKALDSLNRALGRILADVEATRRTGGPPATLRERPLREADLAVIADATEDLMRFEDAVKRQIAAHDETLTRAVQDALPTTGPAPVAPLRNALSRGEEVRSLARQTLAAWAAGRTIPERGLSYVVSNPKTLAPVMERLQRALETYRRNPGSDAASAAEAAARLQREWATANEALRQATGDFDVVVHGDVLPGRPPPAGAPPRVGASAEAAARADTIRSRLTSTPSVADLPRPQLLDELRLSDLDVIAEGALREPIARAGLEKVQLSPAQIAGLKTVPPRLAARLAELFERWQRAHLVGPGFGTELVEGIMLAPEGVNQLVQNKGIEDALRRAHGLGAEVPLTARAKGRRLAIPLQNGTTEVVDVLESARYKIPREGREPIRFDITVNPNGSWSATHHGSLDGYWPAGIPLAGTR
ncbi:MAG TPA: polymorphic toxin type 4 domain-containing protein [Micromonospora sp.]|nr:polymorphic toxin type 4 domain-containing protein [Micromonospora sp.]